MKFCPVVPEICRGHVHGARKERIIIIIRNGAKTISLQTLYGRLNKQHTNWTTDILSLKSLELGHIFRARNVCRKFHKESKE
jgi:hypothetical protein